MVKKLLISDAEVIETWLPVWGVGEPVLGAPPITHIPDSAFKAEVGKAIQFCHPEGPLLGALQ